MKQPIPIGPGVSFWPFPDGDVKPHPYFVISKLVRGNVLVVNITDAVLENGDNFFDLTCILQHGEHPFVLKKSAVYYKKARRHEAHKIGHALANFPQVVRHGPDLDAKLLARIVEGARKSNHMIDGLLEEFGLKI